MFRCIFFILVCSSIWATDRGVLDGSPPKPIDEFVQEEHQPSAPTPRLYVVTVALTKKQERVIAANVTLSDGMTYKVRSQDLHVAESWQFVGPEVDVVMVGNSEGYPYKIVESGTSKFVFARKIKP